MAELLESGKFVLPHDLKNELSSRLKKVRSVKSIEVELDGTSMQGAKEFGQTLLTLKRRGAKISHKVSIKMDFPKGMMREEVLELVERMPRPVQGSIKIKVEASA